MKFLIWFFALTCAVGHAQGKKILTTYQNVYDLDQESKPSKCDCDYRKKTLVLYSDSSFLLEESKGRLDKQVWLSETGTWKVEHDSVLALNVKQVSNTFDKNRDTVYLKTFIIAKAGIKPYTDELWEGRGLVLTGRQNKFDQR